MPEENPNVISLQDRGPIVLTSIDLWDEGQLGAGQLIFRNRYEKLEDVKTAIEGVLSNNSPIAQETEVEKEKKSLPVLSLNRFESTNAHGLRKYDPADPYPTKSRWLVHFLLRFNFGSTDFAYVDLGINWEPLRYMDGSFNPNYPLGADREVGATIQLKDLKILRVCGITVDDAVKLVESFSLTDPKNLEIIDTTVEISEEQLEALKTPEDAYVLTVNVNGDQRVLTHKGRILTCTHIAGVTDKDE